MIESSKNVIHSIQNDVIVVSVQGSEFVMEQAQAIGNLVFNRYDEGHDRIILDITGVSYINSSGISMIIRLNLERRLKLVNIQKPVKDILDLTGILPFISEYHTTQEALADFSRKVPGQK